MKVLGVGEVEGGTGIDDDQKESQRKGKEVKAMKKTAEKESGKDGKYGKEGQKKVFGGLTGVKGILWGDGGIEKQKSEVGEDEIGKRAVARGGEDEASPDDGGEDKEGEVR